MNVSLTNFDYGVVGFYFLFMIAIGFLFRRFVGNTSDYFRGGGQMSWWMAGSSAFMLQFSAWTFTGAASKAYQDGLLVFVIFIGNAVGFLANYWYFAAKSRQTRVVTSVEAIRQRFGKTAEQVFTWLQLPIGTLYAGIWLNGLGVFLAAVFGFDVETTIVVTGGVVLILTLSGGSWAVVASDFVQVLVLMPISVVAAFFALREVGGVGQLLERFPSDRLWGGDTNYTGLIWIWVVAILAKQFASTNNLMDSSRYLCAKDSVNARKGALLASALFVVGPAVWFVPPMVSAILYPNIGEMFPKMQNPEEASYVAICIQTLPAGMIGLLISGIFAATMSSMDSGLNRNAGIFARNFYLPRIRPKADEKELLMAGKISTLFFGICIIYAAIRFSQLEGLGLFRLMLEFGALVAIPMQVPLIWGLLVKRVPDWASWATILVGFGVSYLVRYHVPLDQVPSVFGLDTPLSKRESGDLTLVFGVLANLWVGSAFYLGSSFFYREPAGERGEEVDGFFERLSTPVEANEDGSAERDESQGKLLGMLSLVYGAFVALLAFIPNPLLGRFAFLFCGGVLLAIGYALRRAGREARNARATNVRRPCSSTPQS